MIIVVFGLPGSGKSFFATKLAEKLEAEYVGSDKTRKAIDAMGRYSLNDKFKVYHRMTALVSRAIWKGKMVVVDATFHLQRMRDLFTALARLHHKPIVFIRIESTEEIIRERLTAPRKDSEADFSVYESLKNEFEKVSEPNITLKSGKNNIEEMLKEAMDYILQEHETG
jgi:predicted kinase